MRDVLRRFVREEMDDAGAVPEPEEHAAGVADGIAAFWEEQCGRDQVPCSYVAGMIARALWGLGEPAAAERAAATCRDEKIVAAVRGISQRGLPSLPVWRCLQQRVYREGSWTGAEGDAMWVLDLARVSDAEKDPFPLAWFPALRALLGGMAEFWDATKGRGILGLRGLVPAGSGPGGRKSRARRSRVVREAISFCGSVLEHLRKERGWSEAPRLLLLDAAILTR